METINALPFSVVSADCLSHCTFQNIGKETKTKLVSHDGIIYALFFSDGEFRGYRPIISDIVDYNVFQDDNGGTTVVVVEFDDGSKEKAVLDGNDVFSLDQGLSICITKKLLGGDTSFGSSLYNKLIKSAIKAKEENERFAAEEAKFEQEEKERRERRAAKKKARKEKRIEREIEIHKEAYLRALHELSESNKQQADEAMETLAKYLFGDDEEKKENEDTENTENAESTEQ